MSKGRMSTGKLLALAGTVGGLAGVAAIVAVMQWVVPAMGY